MRPPGSNFGRVLHSQSTKFIPPKRVMSEKTKLRVAIQQAAIKYPRARGQEESEYAEALAKILERRGLGSFFDLSVAVDRQLFGPLRQPRAKFAWPEP